MSAKSAKTRGVTDKLAPTAPPVAADSVINPVTTNDETKSVAIAAGSKRKSTRE